MYGWVHDGSTRKTSYELDFVSSGAPTLTIVAGSELTAGATAAGASGSVYFIDRVLIYSRKTPEIGRASCRERV